jgi:uncharacterized protein (UPF0333 family)
MSIIRLDDRGQISVEYLLLFVVILAVFLFMISHFIGPTIDASNNISAVSDTKIVVDDIANAVNIVYANGPGAKRTVNVNVPHDMTLTFDNTNHVVKTDLNKLNYTLSNGTNSALKTVNATMNYNGAIDPLTLSKGWYAIQVYWDSTSGSFIVNATKS